MTLRLLKAMYGASKALEIPAGINMKIDPYRSVHLTLAEPVHPESFQDYMGKLLNIQETQNKIVPVESETNAIWVHLKVDNLMHAAFLAKHGFKIHHGEDLEVSMYKWISRRAMLIPPYCPFVVSCGAAVINKGRILLVQEKNGARKGDYGLPGGRADIGEHLYSCAERQLWEETGIKAKFKSLLYFRQLPMPKGKDSWHMDIYFVCLMEYQEKALEEMKLCERELSDAKWVPLEEYKKFGAENSKGTQQQVARYIGELAEKGFDFEKNDTPFSKGYHYTSVRDHVKRYVMEHQMARF